MPTDARTLTPSAADLAALQHAIAGDVVRPTDEDYDRVRTPPIARFQGIRPEAVVRCRTVDDVVETLSLVRRSGAMVAVRSGGHCFAGRSSTDGILIDVSPMNGVSVADDIATVGAGMRLGELYDALSARGLAIAGGCGPSVGIAGLALGGGLGILGRKYGLTCDQLVGAQVVLADGRVVDCDERHDPDLFWALRGAGGGQFGVVTTLALRTVPAPTVTTIHLTWPASDAVAVLTAWQSWAPAAPDELAASLLAVAGSDPAQPPSVHLFGGMLGTLADTTPCVEEFVARVAAYPAATRLEQAPCREAKRDLAEHGPGDEPAGAQPEFGYSRSEFFRGLLPPQTVTALIENLAHGRGGERRTLDFTPWGGAYNRVRPEATAFVHRAERFLLKHDVAVAADAPGAEHSHARSWLDRLWSLVHPWGFGGVYPNFPDLDLEDPAAAYYGTNLERLRRVKAAYDPGNSFGFAQSLAA